MEKKTVSKRDNYRDFLRGMAAINIIFIHTAFWSGTGYVSASVQSFSLILDVPFFFFLAGWNITYVESIAKSIYALFNTYKKYIFFLIFYFVCLLAVSGFTQNTKGLTVENLLRNLFFLRLEVTSLPVVMSSMWFMPVYITVVPIGNALLHGIKFIAGKKDYDKNRLQRILILTVFMGLIYTYVGSKTFFLLSNQTLFYLFFFLLGAICKDITVHRFSSVVGFLVLDLAFMKGIGAYFGWDISENMQQMKFPPNIIYLLYSLITIIIALWGKEKFRQINEGNVFCKIGRSAIWFYFCQGISSSLLYFVSPYILLGWRLKLVFMFMINVLLCTAFVMCLKSAYERMCVSSARFKNKLERYLGS